MKKRNYRLHYLGYDGGKWYIVWRGRKRTHSTRYCATAKMACDHAAKEWWIP